MKRKTIRVMIDDAEKQIEVIVKEENNLELVGVVINTEGQFYTHHHVLEALYSADLVENILGNNGTVGYQLFQKNITKILNSIGLIVEDYNLPALLVYWVPLGVPFKVVRDYYGESELVVLRTEDGWINSL